VLLENFPILKNKKCTTAGKIFLLSFSQEIKQSQTRFVLFCLLCINNKNILPAVVHFLFFRIGKFSSSTMFEIEGFYPNIRTPGRCH
jgi:hypothetical protein